MHAIVALGWVGGSVAVVAINADGVAGWGVAGAIEVDARLSAAAALGNGDKDAFEAVYRDLVRDPDLRSLGGRKSARLVRMLAERGRTPAEARQMTRAVGLLWIIDDAAIPRRPSTRCWRRAW